MLIDGQARADRDAGLDWTQITAPANRLDEALRRAHAHACRSTWLTRPCSAMSATQRRALADAARAGRRAGRRPLALGARPPRPVRRRASCGAGGSRSHTWLALADEQLDPVEHVAAAGRRCSSCPALRGEGWQLTPVLSLDAIRLLVSLGGRLERDLRSAVLPTAAAGDAARADQRADAARRAEGVP